MIISVAEFSFRCLQYESEMRPTLNKVLDVLMDIHAMGGVDAYDNTRDFQTVNVMQWFCKSTVASHLSPHNIRKGELYTIKKGFEFSKAVLKIVNPNLVPGSIRRFLHISADELYGETDEGAVKMLWKHLRSFYTKVNVEASFGERHFG
ncbi:hypothetical protein L1987_06501 [Smallanthus sonchifolius]|uniref:Uncharacterized protein n=1 Tax=Smallanthus sonchifolius TaxID=185202 RepID=A0ACB9JYI4_9ASTR|nr:hypothetical protein L1987_06501 [Smallanthus sonchifolius]